MPQWRKAAVALDGSTTKYECEVSEETWNGSEIPRFSRRIAARLVWDFTTDLNCEMHFEWVGGSIHIVDRDWREVIPEIDGWYHWPSGWAWIEV
ncbi:hypothetical protein [Herbidospora cretacea]|uniref:hypothetical protein n=1 Tax=Herbidospora cretacea TaxID=28444 RepID=UPI0007736497|nr:hypothetical protein [Herbidospora cretacea]